MPCGCVQCPEGLGKELDGNDGDKGILLDPGRDMCNASCREILGDSGSEDKAGREDLAEKSQVKRRHDGLHNP